MDIRKITGLSLTQSELDEAARRLALFAPTGSQEYVIDLYDFLAQHALAAMEPGIWAGVEIHNQLRKLTGIKVEYEELIGSLDRLVRKGTVNCSAEKAFLSHARFSLPTVVRDQLRKNLAGQSKTEGEVLDNWKNEIHGLFPELSSSDVDLLGRDLREFVYRLASQNSAESVLLYYAGEKKLEEIIRKLDTDSLDKLLPGRSDTIKRIRAEVLPGFFRTNDVVRKNFIDGLLQSTFILHMIQLDPACSAIVKSQILGGTIYLDTNLIFRLLGLDSPVMFFASRSLLKLSKDLKYKFVVTPQTCEEFRYALKDYLPALQKAPDLPNELLDMVIEASKEGEDLVLAYYRKMQEVRTNKSNSYINPSLYYEYYAEVENLLQDLEIEVSDEHCKEILAQESLLDEETSLLKSIEDNKRLTRNPYNFRELSPYVAEHDAFHRLLILRLRAGNEGTNFFDVPYWFLTCDSKLPSYDKRRRITEKMKTPFCVLSSQWVQTMRPFYPRITAETLVDNLASPLLRAYNPIPNPVVRDMAGRLQLHKGYNPTVGKIAMKRQFLMQFAQVGDNDAKKEEIIESIFEQYAAQAEEEKRKAEYRYARLEEEMAQFRASVDEREKTFTNTFRQLQVELESRDQHIVEEHHARLEAESNLSTAEMKNLDAQSSLESLTARMQQMQDEQGQLRRNLYGLAIVLLYVITLSVARPWITGGLTWLTISGLMLFLYCAILVMFTPWRKQRIGKLFTYGFPFLILGSIALPLGEGQLFYDTIGRVADLVGFIGLIWFLVSKDKDSL